MVEFPTVSVIAILPELVLTLGVVAALFRVVYGGPSTARWLAAIAVATVTLGLVAVVLQWRHVVEVGEQISFGTMVVLDRQAVIGRFVLLVVTGLALAINWRYVVRLGTRGGEALSLVLLAVIGFMFMGASNHLVMLFLGLEVGSISLYILAGLGQESEQSDEAALKYFLLGSVASAIFLYGIALLYTGTGALDYIGVLQFFGGGLIVFADGILTLGVALVFVGLLFKIAAAPFHAWAPDVYQGSPAGIVGFMAAAAKVGALMALLRLIQVPFRTLVSTYQVPIATVAAVSVVVGTLYAIVQSDLRRVLAYSGVAHAGFLLMAVAAGPASAVQLIFYVFTYVVMLVAAFGVVAVVEGPGSAGSPLDHYRGLGRRSPALAAILAVLMFGLAGMPVTAGFIAKFGVFTGAWFAGLEWLVIVGLLASVAAFFFYLRVVVLMFFEEGEGTVPSLGRVAWVGLTVAVVVTLALGVYPSPVLEVLRSAIR